MQDITPETPRTLDAVAAVIKEAGFDTLAREYIERPNCRDRIVVAMRRNIRREFGHQFAERFSYLARKAEA